MGDAPRAVPLIAPGSSDRRARPGERGARRDIVLLGRRTAELRRVERGEGATGGHNERRREYLKAATALVVHARYEIERNSRVIARKGY